MNLFKMFKTKTLEEEKEIFRERFNDFRIPIEFCEIEREYGEVEGGWADILFHCKDIREYVNNSNEIEKIIRDGFPLCHPKLKKIRPNTLKFILDKLIIDDVKDSYYNHEELISRGLFARSYYHRSIPITRRDFLLSDNSGKILSFIEKSIYSNNKTWAKIMYSQKGDEVGIIVSSLQNKEDKKDINFCELYKMRNFSLDECLRDKG